MTAMRTTRTIKRTLAALSVAAALATPALAMPTASATPANCETIVWQVFSDRTICDGPINGDGSWMRHRVIWTPENSGGSSIITCNTGPYSTMCFSSGGGWQPQVIHSNDIYVVTPNTVLPDEPGHLPR